MERKSLSKAKPKKDAAVSDGKTERPTGKSTVDGSEFVFFHGIDNVFSQFHPVKFSVDGREYNCMEQYMHHQKAVIFNDDDIAKQIMDTEDPKMHKKLGRRVQNFDESLWSVKSLEVVKKGNLEKYRQNQCMLEILLSTHPKVLVEASPTDTIWGIGLPMDSKKARDRSQWRGQNLLGKCLTEVRDMLRLERRTGIDF